MTHETWVFLGKYLIVIGAAIVFVLSTVYTIDTGEDI